MGGILSMCLRPPSSRPPPPDTPSDGFRPQSYGGLVSQPPSHAPTPAGGVQYVIAAAYCFRVLDGDTVIVDVKGSDRAGQRSRIRVRGVDCPETAQPYGDHAKNFTNSLVGGKNVSLHVFETDQYGRLVADVITDQGLNLGFELVKNGYAWYYRAYDSRKEFRRLEDLAKSNRLGLWAGKNPVPPWEFRKKVKANRVKR